MGHARVYDIDGRHKIITVSVHLLDASLDGGTLLEVLNCPQYQVQVHIRGATGRHFDRTSIPENLARSVVYGVLHHGQHFRPVRDNHRELTQHTVQGIYQVESHNLYRPVGPRAVDQRHVMSQTHELFHELECVVYQMPSTVGNYPGHEPTLHYTTPYRILYPKQLPPRGDPRQSLRIHLSLVLL